MARVLLALALAACTTPTGQLTQPIIHGVNDSGDSAVVMVAAYPSDHSTLFTCTGEVVSPTAVLTAAHCVDHPGYTFGIFFDEDATSYTSLDTLIPHLSAVSAAHIPPTYDRNAPFTGDIAIANLATPTTVTPLAFAREAPTGATVGATARIIGYGETMYGTNNSRREQATTTVASLDSGDTILVGDNNGLTCIGDSGGPALVAGTIVGVDSYTDTSGCTQAAHFRRTDLYAAFIDQYAGTAPTTGPDAGVTPNPDAGTEPTQGGGGCSTTTAPGLAVLVVLWRLRTRRRRRFVWNPILLA